MNAIIRIDGVKHFDPDVEAAVVARVLAEPKALSDVLAFCEADDFAWDPNARIIEIAQTVREEGLSVSPLAIKARLSGDIIKLIEETAGIPAIDYLEGLAANVSPFQKLPDLAKLIADLAMRRRLDEELNLARQRLCTYERPIMDCLHGVLEATGSVVDKTASARGHLSLGDAADEMMRALEAAANGIAPNSVKTGLARLDNITGGFQAGDLVIVAGRPGMGKTVLLSTICRAAAQNGLPAIMVELEMPRLRLIERLACDLDYDRRTMTQAPLAYTRLRSGKLREGEFDRAFAATQAMKILPLKIYDRAGMSIHEITALIERQVAREKKMGVVCIDYLQIVRPGERYAGSKVNEVTEISNAAKVLAKRIGWPVALGSQLSRAIESRQEKRPTLADLRESGAIEQDADVVIGLHRPAYYIEAKRPANGRADTNWNAWAADWRAVKNDLEIAILKNRNGPPGAFNVHVDIGASVIRNRQDESMFATTDDFYPEGHGA